MFNYNLEAFCRMSCSKQYLIKINVLDKYNECKFSKTNTKEIYKNDKVLGNTNFREQNSFLFCNVKLF